MRKTIMFAMLIAILCSSSVMAQTEGVQPFLEYKKRIQTTQQISPLDSGLFGESISLYNGATSFSVVDIDLPGNNPLPVRLERRMEMDIQPQGTGPVYDTLLRGIGNWQVEVPYMAATYPDATGWSSSRCSTGSLPPTAMGPNYRFLRSEVWNGISIHLPSRGTTVALSMVAQAPKPINGVQYRLTTKQRDMLDCIPMQSGLSGEGFRMITSEGTKYMFNVGVTRTASRLEKRFVPYDSDAEPTPIFLPRKHYYLLASRIEDRLGNWVSFQYNTAGHPTRIWSSDGREILLTYADSRLVNASANGRIWQYQYTPNMYSDPNPNLASVILPDASKWQYGYVGNLKPSTPPASDSLSLPWCRGYQAIVEQPFSVSVTHPSGALGKFDFDNMRHYRSGVHATECQRGATINDEPEYTLVTPYYFDVMSLQSKTISGPGLAARQWAYNYSSEEESFWGQVTSPPTYPCTTCDAEKTVTVSNPDGSKHRHRFGKMYRFNDGRMLGTDVVNASGAVLNAETYDYLPDASASTQLFHAAYGTVLGGISDPVASYIRPVISKTTTQQGRNFVWRVDAICGTNGSTLCFDTMARPTRVVKTSTPAQ
jgi:hypothetical protein